MSMTRRSTRRTAASAEPTHTVLDQSTQEESPPRELPRKRSRKAKAAATQIESKTATQSQSVTKANSASRVVSSARTKTTATTVSKRTTRAAKAAGVGSPLRALEQPEKKRKRTPQNTASATPEPEPVQSEPAHDENNDEQGIFFSKSEPQIFSSPQHTPVALSEDENDVLRKENFQLRARVNELETTNASLVNEVAALRTQLVFQPPIEHFSPHFSPRYSPHFSQPAFLQRSQYLPQHLSQPSPQLRTGQVSANHYPSEFDNDLMYVEETSSPQPTFVNGSESAIALLNKIENAAKEAAHVEPSVHEDGETVSENEVTKVHSPEQPSKSPINQSTTPARSIASPSGFFGRSFFALSTLKNKLGFSTPTQTPTTPTTTTPSFQPSPTPSKTSPPPNTLTETLSIPPTPVGERVKTPSKKRRSNPIMRALLRGVEPEDKSKAEEWAKHVIPDIMNDRASRDKRKRLETPVLCKDLNHFPSSKPWETGFGDPLADLDDEDVVPAWAVYLDMIAEEEEHKPKKRKSIHEGTMDGEEVTSINEQYAANESTHSSPKLHDSRGHSASLLDIHPRRSIDPSPMFDTPVSHHQGGNIFSELQGHDTAAQIRANDREVLQNATKSTVHTHNPDSGSFSVPDDSDEDDSTMISEAPETPTAPLWTQPPPPAPVPAHAPLPGGPVADAPPVPAVQQPVDEIERQRQRLMKHTPAKPSRLREATYPSPSLFSDAGNESILAATPVQMAAPMAPVFADMPGAETIELDDEEQAAFDALVNSDEYKQQLAANPWPTAIITYDSDEEELSPH